MFERLTKAAKGFARNALPAPAYRLYRSRRITGEISRYRPRRVAHTYCGFPLQIALEDPLAEGWYDRDWPILPEIEALRRHRLKPGARVFDLGAHQCVVALILARIVGEEGTVIAVEGESHNARVGERNRELNQAANVRVLNAVAADREQNFSFDRELNARVVPASRISWGTVKVPGITVDGLALRYGAPNVVVVDVEGFEARVLAGAHKTISAGDSDFLVEVHTGAGLEEAGSSTQEILSYFPSSIYRLYVAPDGGAFQTYESREPSSDVMMSRFFLLASPSQLPCV